MPFFSKLDKLVEASTAMKDSEVIQEGTRKIGKLFEERDHLVIGTAEYNDDPDALQRYLDAVDIVDAFMMLDVREAMGEFAQDIKRVVLEEIIQKIEELDGVADLVYRNEILDILYEVVKTAGNRTNSED